MRRTVLLIAGVLVISGARADGVEKERRDVPEAASVVLDGVRYQAPLFTRAEGLSHNGGYVEAIDVSTGRRLWIVDVTGQAPSSGREEDKVDLFLTRLTLTRDRGHIFVEDERGGRYRLDLHTRRVERLKAIAP